MLEINQSKGGNYHAEILKTWGTNDKQSNKVTRSVNFGTKELHKKIRKKDISSIFWRKTVAKQEEADIFVMYESPNIFLDFNTLKTICCNELDQEM